MAHHVPPRARPLVRYVAFAPDGQPLGLVLSVGHDPTAATLLASKRWRYSQDQLTVREWPACTSDEQTAAAEAEAMAADQLKQEALRA